MNRFLKAMIPYLRQVAGLMIVGSIGGIVMNTVVVLPAILLGRAIDVAIAWGEGQATSGEVARAGLAYVAAVAFYQGARVVKRWGLRVGNQRIQASIRADALRGVLAWPLAQLHEIPVGDLMSRIIGDVQVLGRGVSELTTETWDTVLFSVSLIVAMLAFDVKLTLLALVPVPLGMLLARGVGRWVSMRTTSAREASAALMGFLQEHLAGLRVVRLFGRTDATSERVADLSRQLADANLAAIRLLSGLQPLYRLLMTAGVAFVIWLGGGRVVAATMTVGAFIAYLDLYLRFVGRGHRVPQLFNSVQSGAAAYARVKPLLASPLTAASDGRISPLSSLRFTYVPDTAKPDSPLPTRPPGPYAVSVQDVTFRYPGNNALVLDRVWLEIPAGALVAVTGPVGSGKSALARVLLGLYPLESGRVYLDGQPLDALSQAERASRIGYLPQSPYLFSGTVSENITLDLTPQAGGSSERSDSQGKYVQLVALEADVRSFSQGLDTQIGEQGIQVSGGQRQRIALARAAAVEPGLLVLDDPFSSVDVDTEAQIIAQLQETFGPTAPPEQQASIVFFSHRLAAFPHADAVVVLDDGHIVEQGTHEALLAVGGLYARIYRAQERIESQSFVAEETP